MSKLRDRFERDLRIENYSEKTIESYSSAISIFARHFGRCPTAISQEEIKDYIAILNADGKSWSTINLFISAMNKLFCGTLQNPQKVERVNRPKVQKKVPCVLSQVEVIAIFSVIKNIKHKAILMTIYSAGLRVGEACHLKVGDIDSARMRIIVRHAKGHRDREVTLSDYLLIGLRNYYKKYRPVGFLFQAQDKIRPYHTNCVRKFLIQALERAGINKKATPHTLRHSYATHMMDKGIDLRFIQTFLGHKSVKTTLQYCHLSDVGKRSITSPLDDLKLT